MTVNAQFYKANTPQENYKVHPNFHGIKGVSGRKPNPSTMIRRCLALLDTKLPDIFQALIDKALEGDRESQIYLIDRAVGKPIQQTDMHLAGGEELTAGLVAQLFVMLANKRRELELEQQAPVQIEKTGEE